MDELKSVDALKERCATHRELVRTFTILCGLLLTASGSLFYTLVTGIVKIYMAIPFVSALTASLIFGTIIANLFGDLREMEVLIDEIRLKETI